MKEFKTAAILCFCLIVLGIAAFSIWSVRQFLPVLGAVLLVVLVVGALLALAWAIVHVHHKFTAYNHIPIAQYGSVLHRRNSIVEIAPYHPPVMAQKQLGTTVKEDMPELPELEGPEEDLPIPSFRDMWLRGEIQEAIGQAKMFLGFHPNGQPRLGDWKDLYSCGIGGVSGSGKSTTVRFLLFQALLGGAMMAMVDPDIQSKNQSLAASFMQFYGVHLLPPCDNSERDFIRRIEKFEKELARRTKLGLEEETPWILVLDEFNKIIMEASDELRERLVNLLYKIGTDGRKFHIYTMLIAQQWTERDLGGKNMGARIRRGLATKAVHRFGEKSQAQVLIDSAGKRSLTLKQGHWIFQDTQGNFDEMVTPETNAHDGAFVADYLRRVVASRATSAYGSPASAPTSRAAMEPLRLLPTGEVDADLDVEDEGVDVQSAALTPEAMRVLSMLREKKGQNEIIEEVWGMKSSDGRPYRAAVEEYRAVLAILASRIGA